MSSGMGGGTVWRGVARLVSPAVKVASASAGGSCSFCKVNPAGQTLRAQSARVRSCSCPPETTSKPGNASQQGTLSLWEPDEWEFAEEEATVDHLVFGSLPSRKEVEEASAELQDALRLGLLASSGDQARPSLAVSSAIVRQGDMSEHSSVTSEKDEDEGLKSLVGTRMPVDWMEPPPIRSGRDILQAGGRNDVVEAFHQFQHNPEVQSMVVSLATDPAVWDAVLANEKIQEFKRKLQGDKGYFAEKDPMFTDFKESINSLENSDNVFARWLTSWQGKLSHLMELLSSVIHGFFKAADKKVFAEEDGDIVDRTVKSCTMLALIVLCVVILKRLVVQAA